MVKRMGTALRKVRTNVAKSKGISLGGRGNGKLTAKLTKYYGKAICDIIGDAEAMAKAV